MLTRFRKWIASALIAAQLAIMPLAFGQTGPGNGTNPVPKLVPGGAVASGGPVGLTGAGAGNFPGGAAGETLSIASGKAVAFSNTLTCAGTETSSIAFGAGGTIGRSGYAALG